MGRSGFARLSGNGGGRVFATWQASHAGYEAARNSNGISARIVKRGKQAAGFGIAGIVGEDRGGTARR